MVSSQQDKVREEEEEIPPFSSPALFSHNIRPALKV